MARLDRAIGINTVDRKMTRPAHDGMGGEVSTFSPIRVNRIVYLQRHWIHAASVFEIDRLARATYAIPRRWMPEYRCLA
jgi:hypothetical protein